MPNNISVARKTSWNLEDADTRSIYSTADWQWQHSRGPSLSSASKNNSQCKLVMLVTRLMSGALTDGSWFVVVSRRYLAHKFDASDAVLLVDCSPQLLWTTQFGPQPATASVTADRKLCFMLEMFTESNSTPYVISTTSLSYAVPEI